MITEFICVLLCEFRQRDLSLCELFGIEVCSIFGTMARMKLPAYLTAQNFVEYSSQSTGMLS
jgi:hypothetical protein